MAPIAHSTEFQNGPSHLRRATLRRATLLCASAACALTSLSARADDGRPGDADCDRVSIPVALSASDPTSYSIAAWVCGHRRPHASTVQLLLHGSTYSHTYWNFAAPSRHDSYVDAARDEGYVTVNVDRIGIGESDHPPATLVTVESNAFVVHQIIAALRAGTIAPDGRALVARRVVLVGHSLGSDVAAVEAATYADADGVVLSGFLHNEGPQAIAFGNDVYPASLDPVTSGAPPLYFTTLPGTRGTFFYDLADADPAVVTQDEATKQTVTVGELGTFVDGFGATPGIHVPVLLAVGDDDVIFCDAPSCSAGNTLAREAAYFAPDAQLETFILPRSGHSMNLHRNAPLWYDAANDWIGRRVERGR